MPHRGIIARFLALTGDRKRLLAEAVLALAVASAATHLLPFRRAVRLGSWRLGRSTAADPRDAVWAVEAAAARVPWKAACFQQGLALQAMLRRRGIEAQLHYGVGYDQDRSLSAHVWLSSDGTILIGGEQAPHYRLLASLPGEDGRSG